MQWFHRGRLAFNGRSHGVQSLARGMRGRSSCREARSSETGLASYGRPELLKTSKTPSGNMSLSFPVALGNCQMKGLIYACVLLYNNWSAPTGAAWNKVKV